MKTTIIEAHGLNSKDVKKVKDLIDMFEDKEIKRILKFLVKSNVEVDKTQDVTKMKKENKHPMKITKKILEDMINQEAKNVLLEQAQAGPVSSGEYKLGVEGNKAHIEGLQANLDALHSKLDELLELSREVSSPDAPMSHDHSAPASGASLQETKFNNLAKLIKREVEAMIAGQ